MSYYVIYKTVNQINGRYYIGKHVTENVYDDYLGSGTLLTKALKKYGKENFKKEILHYCSSKEELDKKEKEIVHQQLINDPKCYNLALGGQGGNLGYLINKKIGHSMSKILKGRKKTKSHIDSISKSKKGYTVSDETKEKIGKTVKKLRQDTDIETKKKLFAHYGEENGFYNKKHTEETKRKIRETIGDSRKGSKHPTAKSVTFKGKTFGCKKDCAEYFNISKYMLNKLLGDLNG